MEVIQWTDASPGAKSNDANADASLNDFLAQKNWLNQVFLRIFYVDVISVPSATFGKWPYIFRKHKSNTKWTDICIEAVESNTNAESCYLLSKTWFTVRSVS